MDQKSRETLLKNANAGLAKAQKALLCPQTLLLPILQDTASTQNDAVCGACTGHGCEKPP